MGFVMSYQYSVLLRMVKNTETVLITMVPIMAVDSYTAGQKALGVLDRDFPDSITVLSVKLIEDKLHKD